MNTSEEFQVILDDENVNQGTRRGSASIKESLIRLRAGRSILTDKNGKIIAGNQTYKEAQELGIELEPYRSTGDKLLVHVREDLDLDNDPDGTARALALADNRTQELSYNPDEEMIAYHLDTETDLTYLWRLDEQEVYITEPDDSPISNLGQEDTDPEGEEPANGEHGQQVGKFKNNSVSHGGSLPSNKYNDSGEGEPPSQDKSDQVRVDKRPLPIVLDREGQRQWNEVKERLKVKSDKVAFSKLVEQFLEAEG